MTRKKLLIGIALALYLAGYPVARSLRIVVHAAGYGTLDDGSKVVMEHSMRSGDTGIPMLPPGATLIVWSTSLLYLPVCPFEVLYWNIVQPPGSPYPYALSPEMEPPESP